MELTTNIFVIAIKECYRQGSISVHSTVLSEAATRGVL